MQEYIINKDHLFLAGRQPPSCWQMDPMLNKNLSNEEVILVGWWLPFLIGQDYYFPFFCCQKANISCTELRKRKCHLLTIPKIFSNW